MFLNIKPLFTSACMCAEPNSRISIQWIISATTQTCSSLFQWGINQRIFSDSFLRCIYKYVFYLSVFLKYPWVSRWTWLTTLDSELLLTSLGSRLSQWFTFWLTGSASQCHIVAWLVWEWIINLLNSSKRRDIRNKRNIYRYIDKHIYCLHHSWFVY